MQRLRGVRALVHDAIEHITTLVEDTQENAARRPVALLGMPKQLAPSVREVDALRRVTAQTVFDSIRSINRGVQQIGDVAERLVEQGVALVDDKAFERLAASPLGARADALFSGVQGALNAVVGDYLRERNSALAIDMTLLIGGQPAAQDEVALRAQLGPDAHRLCVFVHGLGCTEAAFVPSDRDRAAGAVSYAERLATDLGFTPLFLRYNTGLHISENGRRLSQLLDALLRSHPEAQQLVLVGHSMGGLVCRSAAHYAELDGSALASRLTHVFCIGSPHLGAPLERASNALGSVLGFFDVAGTQVPAKLLNVRSAGIKDLGFGYIRDEDWTGRDPDRALTDAVHDVPTAKGVVYGFVASRWLESSEHPLGALLGDLLVSVESASGGTPNIARHVPFQLGHVVSGVHHQALLTHAQVYEQLVRLLASPAL